MDEHDINENQTIQTDRAFYELLVVIVVSAAASGLFFYLGPIWFPNPNHARAFRAVRMCAIYIIFPILWAKFRWGISPADLGLNIRKLGIAWVGGIMTYLVALAVFVEFHIFETGWKYASQSAMLYSLLLIIVMACATDFWTRGFVLLSADRMKGWKVAVLLQNVTWFSIHWYEIEAISGYFCEGIWGYVAAIMLTLFLGFAGDAAALSSKNVTGLMFGHVVLNMGIIGNARSDGGYFGILKFWLSLI